MKTTRQVLAKKLIALLDEYGLKKNIVVCVKNEGANLNAMTMALKSMVSCEILSLYKKKFNTCFRHVFSKAFQYGIAKDRVYKIIKHVSIKVTQ